MDAEHASILGPWRQDCPWCWLARAENLCKVWETRFELCIFFTHAEASLALTPAGRDAGQVDTSACVASPLSLAQTPIRSIMG